MMHCSMWGCNEVCRAKHRVVVSLKGRKVLKITAAMEELEFLVFHASDIRKIETKEQMSIK